jgi:hypothetical protein
VTISKGERDELAKIVRLQMNVANSGVAQRERDLLAETEDALANHFELYDEAWKESRLVADAAIAALNARVNEICDERGIAKRFRPSASVWWMGRGENTFKERRAELRKVAQTRIAADAQRAKAGIEARGAVVLTELFAGGIESGEGKRFLESIPTPAELMLSLSIADLEAGTAKRGLSS